jgi:hypothetical protein
VRHAGHLERLAEARRAHDVHVAAAFELDDVGRGDLHAVLVHVGALFFAELQRREAIAVDDGEHVRRRVAQSRANVPADLAVRIDALPFECDLRADDEIALHLVVRVVHLVVGEPDVFAGCAEAVLLQFVVVAECAGALDGADVLVGGELAGGVGLGDGG